MANVSSGFPKLEKGLSLFLSMAIEWDVETNRCYDAEKRINGRKCHIIVDTMELILAGVVHGGGIQNRDGAKLFIMKIRDEFPRLKLIWADGGYAVELIEWIYLFDGWILEIVKCTKKNKRICRITATLGSGEYLWLDWPLSWHE